MNTKILGFNIRAERRRQDLSQAQLAELANLTANSICSIEKGEQIPNAINLYFIAKALNIDIKLLFNGLE